MSLHTLMFGWEYPPTHCGGLGVACQGIVKGLLHHGAEVTLVLPHAGAVENGITIRSSHDLTGSVSSIQVPCVLQPYDSFATYQTRLHGMSNNPREQQLYGEDLAEEVERFTAASIELTRDVTPDVVHSHDWMTLDAGARAAKYHRVPLIAHVHATELDRTDFRPNPWIFKREMKGFARAEHLIAVSGYTRDLLVREYGISARKISVLHNGTFDSRPTRHEDVKGQKHPLVLFLGRLTAQKGAFQFLEAARKVADHRKDALFVVAGDGYLLPKLVSQACNLGLSDRVLFAGRVNSVEAKKLYEKTDCFVMPSVSEPFGLVALEAITHGAPVVLSRQSGASEVVRNSLLVDFWDIDKMADSILTVLREEPLRKALRTESHRVLTSLSWASQAEKILSLYDSLLTS